MLVAPVVVPILTPLVSADDVVLMTSVMVTRHGHMVEHLGVLGEFFRHLGWKNLLMVFTGPGCRKNKYATKHTTL